VERSRPLRVNLRIEVRDRHGKLVDVREKESDLILNNFKEILAALFRPQEMIAVGVTRTASIVDWGGTALNIPIWANDVNASGQGLCFTGAHRSPELEIGGWIWVGTSTVAPTRNDYKIGASVARGRATQTVGADYISWAVSITLETAADIAEAVMTCVFQIYFKATTTVREVALFRDTFTPVSVPAGGTISVTYTLTL